MLILVSQYIYIWGRDFVEIARAQLFRVPDIIWLSLCAYPEPVIGIITMDGAIVIPLFRIVQDS
jgi:hypothetical protein